jgi:flagellar hook-length control protein FliK
MLDEARPDDRPMERTQAQPRDRARPAEKSKASSETQSSDKPAPASQGDATVSGETETTLSTIQIVSGSNEPALAPDATGFIVPAEGTNDQALDAIVPNGTAPEAPVPQAAVLVPPTLQDVPIPTINAGAPDISQTSADAALPNAPAIPALPADTAPATAGTPQNPESKQAPAVDAPSADTKAVPQSSQTQGEQPKPAAAAAPAEPTTPPKDPEAAVETAVTANKVKAQASETDVPSSAEADMNADTAPTDNPKQAKPAPAQPARAETTSDKPAPQTDAALAADDALVSEKSGIDPSMRPAQIATPVPAHAAAPHALAPQAAPVSAAQPIPVNAVAVEIAAQARAGNSRFEIRLDPPELGRIDVRLDIDNDGNVKSRLIIERTDTYDLLRRDQSTLERALQQAGLKTSDNALEFSLRDQGFAQHRDHDDQPRGVKAMIGEAEIAPSEAANGYARLLAARGGLDIRV